MRLIETDTLKLRDFHPQQIPPYAILSHTWTDDEVTYQEMRQPIAEHIIVKGGYEKIRKFSALLKSTTWDYFWVDTCCINKESSAELSEAINSMYQWYKGAEVCYVHLDGVHFSSDVETLSTLLQDHAQRKIISRQFFAKSWEDFEGCRWCTRGWTLQELIAPEHVLFFSADWRFCFGKMELLHEISGLLQIDREVLRTSDPSTACVGQRISWVSRRVTSRPEDMAYCLLGLLGVNMPMLYGEGGENAFIRLQEEYMKTSDDHSLFAWKTPLENWASYRGLLARHPSYFAASGDIYFRDYSDSEGPFSSTNKGLSLILPMTTVVRSWSRGLHVDLQLALLPGVYRGFGLQVGVFLQWLGGKQYARIDSHVLFEGRVLPGTLSVGDRTPAVNIQSFHEGELEVISHGDQLVPKSLYVRQNIRFYADCPPSRIHRIVMIESFKMEITSLKVDYPLFWRCLLPDKRKLYREKGVDYPQHLEERFRFKYMFRGALYPVSVVLFWRPKARQCGILCVHGYHEAKSFPLDSCTPSMKSIDSVILDSTATERSRMSAEASFRLINDEAALQVVIKSEKVREQWTTSRPANAELLEALPVFGMRPATH